MRSHCPEYLRWQEAMRPEDTGAQDGRRAGNGGEVQARQFASKVAHYLEGRTRVVRNNFAGEEHGLWAKYILAKLDAHRLQAALESLGGSGSAPAIARRAPMQRGVALAAGSVLGFALVALLWFLFTRIGMAGDLAIVLGMAVSLALVGISCACGVLLCRTRQQWHRVACLAIAVATALTLLWAFAALPVAGLGTAERWLLGVASVLCCLGLGFVAHQASDPDPHASRIEREAAEAVARLTDLVARRNENSEFHINVAHRHRELAGQMISDYRQAYVHAASAGSDVTSLLDFDTQFTEVDVTWFKLHEGNTP